MPPEKLDIYESIVDAIDFILLTILIAGNVLTR